VKRYVIIGSSLGGAQAVIAARELRPEPVGVIGLSPSYVPDVAADDYDGPLLVIASTHDPTFSIETSRAVARAAEPDTFVELSGTAHGLQLLRGEHRADVEHMVDEFLADAFSD
jgi:alpha-beta hydrolase superfamily lysophospholipase